MVTVGIELGLIALGAGRGAILFADLLIAILMGFEAASLQRWTLSRRNWRQLDIVVADDAESAERRFFDHMLDLLARHSRIDITVKADGDLHVDHHHTTEDVGIALGQAVKQALGTMAGITRYASIHMPMDETLSRVVIDISGRPVLVFKVEFPRDKVGQFDTELVREWFNGSMPSPSMPA